MGIDNDEENELADLKKGDVNEYLLIYPEFPDTFWSFKHALKFVCKKADSLPLGLLAVAMEGLRRY